ncbi:MAG: apolipoprotein N-acyltransferase, partial [Bacteroidales bacterium]|nr:apolipoprotein N-acyltransferase [Bacteroidales bacterium]
MSIPWLVPHTGLAALVAFVPLLCAERIARIENIRRFWPWAALCFLLWNVFTTFWVCNATIGGGITAFLYNTFWMTLIFSLYRLSRKVLDGVLPYIFLACLWICLEKLYFAAQISWPWLTLGGAFARTTALCQWYEYTGILGGSAWIWAVNLGIFGLMCGISDRMLRTRVQRGAAIAAVILSIAVPVGVSLAIYGREGDVCGKDAEKLAVTIVQPNIDPYRKFEALSQEQQDSIALRMLEDGQWYRDGEAIGSRDSSLLLLLPETFTNNINLIYPDLDGTVINFSHLLKKFPCTTLMMGATTYDFFPQEKSPSYTARPFGHNMWYEVHNSAVTVTFRGFSQHYHKNKLVVGVELMPYPKFFSKIDNMLGGVMGRCIGQKNVEPLHVGPTLVGCAICYESVYGDFCRQYVLGGAEAMTIITNDAWWKDTPGYRQHLSYARLRAIELRRDIARCANTGISAIINRRGDVLSSTPWWESALINGHVNLYKDQTFFVRHGDITGRIATLVTCLLAALVLVKLLMGILVGRP